MSKRLISLPRGGASSTTESWRWVRWLRSVQSGIYPPQQQRGGTSHVGVASVNRPSLESSQSIRGWAEPCMQMWVVILERPNIPVCESDFYTFPHVPFILFLLFSPDIVVFFVWGEGSVSNFSLVTLRATTECMWCYGSFSAKPNAVQLYVDDSPVRSQPNERLATTKSKPATEVDRKFTRWKDQSQGKTTKRMWGKRKIQMSEWKIKETQELTLIYQRGLGPQQERNIRGRRIFFSFFSFHF